MRYCAHAVCITLILSHSSILAEEPCRFEAGSAFLYGWVEGSLQTPNGGELATTSDDRPTLKELDIDTVSMVDFWMNAQRPRDGFYVGGRRIRLRGNSTLDTDLLSQAKTFPAGSPVEAHVTFDWYRFGYSWRHLHQWDGHTIDYGASLGGILLMFDYNLRSPGLESVDRSYGKGGIQIGVHASTALTDHLTLSGRLFVPVAMSNSMNILSAQLTAKYQFLKRENLEIAGLFGVGYEQIRYRDNQLVPNNIKLDIRPLLTAGVEIVF
jgi:hypothetical protein